MSAEYDLNDPLGPATDILDNQRVTVARWREHTKLWLAKKTAGRFGGWPDMSWGRRLTDAETQQMLENPYRIFASQDASGRRVE